MAFIKTPLGGFMGLLRERRTQMGAISTTTLSNTLESVSIHFTGNPFFHTLESAHVFLEMDAFVPFRYNLNTGKVSWEWSMFLGPPVSGENYQKKLFEDLKNEFGESAVSEWDGSLQSGYYNRIYTDIAAPYTGAIGAAWHVIINGGDHIYDGISYGTTQPIIVSQSPISPVPIPGAFGLFLLGMAGLGCLKRAS